MERTLNRIGAQVAGMQPFHADRITDVVDMIDELGKRLAAVEAELKRVSATQDTIREWAKSKPWIKNGEGDK